MTTQRDLPLVWASGGGQTPTGDAKYVSGWVAEIPSFQNFNYVLANATGNILVQAEQGHHNWDAAIQYQTGAQVVDGGLVYACHTASIGSSITGAQPSLDATFSYWVTGAGMFGPAAVGELKQTDGILIDGINTRASAATWDGNDVTIKNSNAIISFNITSATVGLPNWSLANVNGEMLLIDNGISTTPTGKSIAPGAATVSRIYHEAHPPTQSEVAGTIPDGPQDGEIYGRSNGNWVKVTSTTVSTSPPPPVAGSGQGWYNLDDGTTYVDVDDGDSSQWVPASPATLPEEASSTEVNTGTNSKYVSPAALSGSNYVKDQYYGVVSYFVANEDVANITGTFSDDISLGGDFADCHGQRMGDMVMLTGALEVDSLTSASPLPNDSSCQVDWDITSALTTLGVNSIVGGNGSGTCTPVGSGVDFSTIAVEVRGLAGTKSIQFNTDAIMSFPFSNSFSTATPTSARFQFSIMLQVT
tara:strand:- start:13815 stop:15233 length:1419 start_codon:yes stop_codon:yes gene_type:complete